MIMMEEKCYVRLEKLKQVSETNTLGVGYWVKGRLVNEIEVGQPVLVERYIRNDVKVYGVMNTSVVKSIEPMGNGVLHLHTMNSVYRVDFLDEKEFLKETEGTKLNVVVVQESEALAQEGETDGRS